MEKYIKSKYYGVSGYSVKDGVKWAVRIFKGVNDRGKQKALVKQCGYKTERLAAIAVDTYLITKGLEPRNILKPKA